MTAFTFGSRAATLAFFPPVTRVPILMRKRNLLGSPGARSVVRAALARVQAPTGVAVIPRTTRKGDRILEITTVRFEQAERIRTLHPVRDLMEGEDRLTEDKLVDYVNKHVPPRTRGRRGSRTFPRNT
jgi:hypothetical protein